MQHILVNTGKRVKGKLRFLIVSYLMLSYAFVQAQTTDSLRLRLNAIFQGIDKSQVPTGYLAEYGIPFVNLFDFTGQINSPSLKCNMQILRQ